MAGKLQSYLPFSDLRSCEWRGGSLKGRGSLFGQLRGGLRHAQHLQTAQHDNEGSGAQIITDDVPASQLHGIVTYDIGLSAREAEGAGGVLRGEPSISRCRRLRM